MATSTQTRGGERRQLLISKGWVQASILVLVFGFSVLVFLAFLNYDAEPPIPQRAVSPDGTTVFTADDIHAGQKVFLENGLMEYGTVFGHGAYLGPDFTADYLERSAQVVTDRLGGHGDVVAHFKTNTYDESAGTLALSGAQVDAFEANVDYNRTFFADPTTRHGLRPEPITDPTEVHQLTAFFAWTAWAASALRPGKDYSYTNNWPPSSAVGNTPSGAALVWSALGLVALLGGIGVLLAVFGRWRLLGWHGDDDPTIRFRSPDDVAITPAQRACSYFFLVMALLMLAQVLAGGLAQHYRADPSSFYGIDIAKVFPFNLVRTWHVQLAIFWVATSYLASGIFIAPLMSHGEPRRQHWLVHGLLGAVAIVVFGSLIGEFAGIHGWLGGASTVVGDQGFEYLDLGRLWQVLLVGGLFIWVVIVARGIKSRLGREHKGNLPWLFFFAALAIPAVYAVGLLARTGSTATSNEFWRFWVVHLWVEGFLELFTTVIVAYVFVLLGVVNEKVALRLVYLDVILYSAGGVIGTMHHLYFSGSPVEMMALGSVFSALEVIPLTFLTVEAWTFLRLGKSSDEDGEPRRGTAGDFPHKWAVAFLAATGFWNFVGAGVLGFLINLPIVSYYEIGTALTANHGHAAFFGVYGMLAVGLALFCLRYLIPADRWSDRAARVSFWSMNIGLAWMVVATLMPIGILQLAKSVDAGYAAARSAEFLDGGLVHFLEWARLPGDMLIIVGGALPLVWMCWKGVRGRRSSGVPEAAEELLFVHAAPEEPHADVR